MPAFRFTKRIVHYGNPVQLPTTQSAFQKVSFSRSCPRNLDHTRPENQLLHRRLIARAKHAREKPGAVQNEEIAAISANPEVTKAPLLLCMKRVKTSCLVVLREMAKLYTASAFKKSHMGSMRSETIGVVTDVAAPW
jgi:hypothetical protein